MYNWLSTEHNSGKVYSFELTYSNHQMYTFGTAAHNQLGRLRRRYVAKLVSMDVAWTQQRDAAQVVHMAQRFVF